jgi:hypothetical protein
MPLFDRYCGIDYSGAQTSESGLTGLRLFVATRTQAPAEVLPPSGPRKLWTRRSLAEWLVAELRLGPPTLVGIDHAFSFPQRYFEQHRLATDWPAFLDDFQCHWPTDRRQLRVDCIRHGYAGGAAARSGDSHWRRLAEVRCRAKSVFHFDCQGSVAKSTHAGLPWLRFLRRQLGPRLHCWPFDGWQPPHGRPVIAEVYPSLWNRTFAAEGRNSHQQDAYCVARWMKEADADGSLGPCFNPRLSPVELGIASIEGWILGLR